MMTQMGKSAETMNFYTFCTLNHPNVYGRIPKMLVRFLDWLKNVTKFFYIAQKLLFGSAIGYLLYISNFDFITS